jgi:hypothetical protein
MLFAGHSQAACWSAQRDTQGGLPHFLSTQFLVHARQRTTAADISSGCSLTRANSYRALSNLLTTLAHHPSAWLTSHSPRTSPMPGALLRAGAAACLTASPTCAFRWQGLVRSCCARVQVLLLLTPAATAVHAAQPAAMGSGACPFCMERTPTRFMEGAALATAASTTAAHPLPASSLAATGPTCATCTGKADTSEWLCSFERTSLAGLPCLHACSGCRTTRTGGKAWVPSSRCR